MPYVNVQITRGASRAQKQALVAEITGALVRALGKSPQHIHVVIQEIAEEDWGFAGLSPTTGGARRGGERRRARLCRRGDPGCSASAAQRPGREACGERKR